ncbi:unnamed protein product [Somion occarium]|uniref:Succinate dehydrogenase assembly factor 4, mitochondrial n=1 Tax=Somion occarium TaxID=3059160 RepID=A0ABP1CPF1_9APHY
MSALACRNITRSTLLRNGLLSRSARSMSSSSPPDPLNRPGPPPLPRAQQREFEELVRKAQTPLANGGGADVNAVHPDARPPVTPEFEGDVNPVTGERGGPKREPVKKWGDEGDWSYKGKVSDF